MFPKELLTYLENLAVELLILRRTKENNSYLCFLVLAHTTLAEGEYFTIRQVYFQGDNLTEKILDTNENFNVIKNRWMQLAHPVITG